MEVIGTARNIPTMACHLWRIEQHVHQTTQQAHPPAQTDRSKMEIELEED